MGGLRWVVSGGQAAEPEPACAGRFNRVACSDAGRDGFGTRRQLMARSRKVDSQFLDDFRRPAAENPDPIRKIDGFFDVVSNEQDRHAPAAV